MAWYNKYKNIGNNKFRIYYSPCLPLYTFKNEREELPNESDLVPALELEIAEYYDYVNRPYCQQTLEIWSTDIRKSIRELDKTRFRYFGKKIYKIDKIELLERESDYILDLDRSRYYTELITACLNISNTNYYAPYYSDATTGE